MIDPIDAALLHIKERCKVSWSENEIIELVENVRRLRKEERKLIMRLPVVDKQKGTK